MMMRPLVAFLVVSTLAMVSIGNAKPKEPKEAPDKPLRVFFLAGQSNMVGPGHESYLKQNRPELLIPRDDVFAIKWGHPTGPLRCGYGGRETSFGPELMFGHKVGDALDEHVILIKAAWGGKTLVKDFRPPTAVAKRGGEVGPYYTLMMMRFAKALQHLKTHVPEVADRGYELAGFVWLQGENDCCINDQAVWNEYEKNLTDLIHDVRTSLGTPKMPVMIIQINKSMWGNDEPDPKTGTYKKGGYFVRKAQKTVAEADDNAGWVPTKDLNQGYHYDSASHVVIGERAGKAMLPLLAKDVRDDRNNQAVKALVKKYVLSKVLPPAKAAPNFNALCKGLYAYFPFDEGEGTTVTGGAAQPVVGTFRHIAKKQNMWTKGISGQAIRMEKSNFLTFPQFKEPTDDKGLLGDLTVSFWYQTNTKLVLTRIGRGAGQRMALNGSNWFYSREANYAGWDITHFDCDGPVAFTASFDGVGPRAIIGPKTYGDGIKWTHIVATYNRKTGTMRTWVDGDYPKPRPSKRKRKKPAPVDPLAKGGIGIISANLPLSIGVELKIPNAHAAFDELAMWNRVLTDDEIKSLYNNGHGVKLPGDITP